MQNEDCALAISQGMQIFVALAKFHRAANIRSLANFMLLFFLLFDSEFGSSQIIPLY